MTNSLKNNIDFMIYLIGGAPRVGKSIMAKQLALLAEAACVSIDEICEDELTPVL